MTYTAPDYNLDDIEADNRDARDLEQEAKREAAWDELLSDDGDISEVLEMLTEYPEDVLPLIESQHRGDSLKDAAERLAQRLHALAGDVIEEGVE